MAAYERLGCEDPRVTVIGRTVYMLYTAWDGVLGQLAMASAPLEDLEDPSAWLRHGILFPGVANRNGCLFPERIRGRWYLLHRPYPSIWLTSSPRLECPWPGRRHRVIM